IKSFGTTSPLTPSEVPNLRMEHTPPVLLQRAEGISVDKNGHRGAVRYSPSTSCLSVSLAKAALSSAFSFVASFPYHSAIPYLGLIFFLAILKNPCCFKRLSVS